MRYKFGQEVVIRDQRNEGKKVLCTVVEHVEQRVTVRPVDSGDTLWAEATVHDEYVSEALREEGAGKKDSLFTLTIGTVGKPVNGIMYPVDIMERELERLFGPGVSSGSRGVYGTIETSSSGIVRLADVSHVVRKAWIKGSRIKGQVQVFDTDKGRKLKGLIRVKETLEMRPIGHGSTRRDENGTWVVQEDYRLEAFVVKFDSGLEKG